VEREATRLGFRARGETVQLGNGDGGGDSNSLCFYVAITLPQMPLFEIDGMVNLFFAWRTKERHLFFSACWQDCSTQCEIKFSGGQTTPSAQQRLEFRAALDIAFLFFHNINKHKTKRG
jgi:hypothetical protein